MRRSKERNTILSFLAIFCVACLLNGVTWADEEETEAGQQEQARGRVTRWIQTASQGKYWIGIACAPASDALRAQLGLPERLVVQQVVDDSPAAEAGIQRYDIVLKYGDQEIKQMGDLLKAVEAGETKPTTVTLLHEGQEKTVEVTASDAPRQEVRYEFRGVDGIDANTIRNWIDSQNQKLQGAPFGFSFVAPRLIEKVEELEQHEHHLPGNWTITITKSGEAPAKIIVRHGEEEWETSGQEIGQAPCGNSSPGEKNA
jgi:membrane-associated protease RseP (regulator of RpoE activity)